MRKRSPAVTAFGGLDSETTVSLTGDAARASGVAKPSEARRTATSAGIRTPIRGRMRRVRARGTTTEDNPLVVLKLLRFGLIEGKLSVDDPFRRGGRPRTPPRS